MSDTYASRMQLLAEQAADLNEELRSVLQIEFGDGQSWQEKSSWLDTLVEIESFLETMSERQRARLRYVNTANEERPL